MIIESNATAADLYEGAAIDTTPAGTYKGMRLQSLKATLSQAGNVKLNAFFVHTDGSAYKGVRFTKAISGTDKNGNPNSANLAQFLFDIGFSKEDAIVAKADVSDNIDPADWKGVPLNIVLNGDFVTVAGDTGRTATVTVEDYSANGKTGTRAKGVYRN